MIINGVEVISLYYDDDSNVMQDVEGNVFYDIFRIIPPSRYNYLKEVRGTEYIRNVKPGVVYELVFPYYDEEYDLFGY